MKAIKKLVLFFIISLTPVALHAGFINWIYVGFGYLGNGIVGGSSLTIYDLILGTGQMFPIGKFTIYSAENLNYVMSPAMGNVGYGVNANLDLAYKIIGESYAKKGFEMEVFLGGFAEFDISLLPFDIYYAYGPELGMNFQFWFTPGFGLNLQAKCGYNVSGWGDPFFPSGGLAMMWRRVDESKLAFAKEKKKVKTSSLNAGIYQKDGNVMFVYESPRTDIKSIALIGDFNNWNTDGIMLQEDGGVWKVVIKLDPGLYQYKYLINGKEQIVDPKSPGYTPDGLGGKNSFLEVE